MRHVRFRGGVLGAVLPIVLVSPAAARAVTVPAYGTITIRNPGLGPQVTSTYDKAFWDCKTEIDGLFDAPEAVHVRCTPLQTGISFGCPFMVVTVVTGTSASQAGGKATCTSSIDTGVISGVNTARVFGDLGAAPSVTCTAYVNDLTLIPPYDVTCFDPGLPYS